MTVTHISSSILARHPDNDNSVKNFFSLIGSQYAATSGKSSVTYIHITVIRFLNHTFLGNIQTES